MFIKGRGLASPMTRSQMSSLNKKKVFIYFWSKMEVRDLVLSPCSVYHGNLFAGGNNIDGLGGVDTVAV
jgi:hypothetical protein